MDESQLQIFAECLKKYSQEQLYREALRTQVEINWDFAKDYLKNCDPFIQAKSVNDFGCGPGDLIIKLATEFPEKSFAGYDLSTEFIETANHLSAQHNVRARFKTLNLMDDDWPKADFTIFRNVLQHLKNLEGFVGRANQFILEGSHILINDTADDKVYSMTEPPIQQWDFAMQQLAAKQKEFGGNRNAVSDFLNLLPPAWQILNDQVVNLNIKKTDRYAFAQYVLSAANLLPKFFNMAVDCEKLKDEVVNWFVNNESSANFKFRWILLKKN